MPIVLSRSALMEVITQNQNVSGYAMDHPGYLQHLRRAIFSLNNRQFSLRNRNRRRSNETADDPEADADADADDAVDVEADNASNEESEDAEMPSAAAAGTEAEPANSIRFDTNLPAEHSYMGANMDRVCGVNYLDVGQHYNMMLFMHQHILFPGEVLPFMISGSIMDADIDADNGLLFGVCFPDWGQREDLLYGVTCQIYEKGSDERGNTLIKSRALQRFVTKGSELSG